MKKIIAVIYAFFSILVSIPYIIILKVLKKEEKFYSLFLRNFAKGYLKILNVEIKIYDENIDKDYKKTLIVSNHLSTFDIIVFLSYFQNDCIYISKKENSHFPIVSTWMRMIDTIFIDRSNIKENIKKLAIAAKILKNTDKNVVIFPQGTRNLNTVDFKPGSLKIAQKAEVNILPVGLKNTNLILSTKRYKKTIVELHVNKLIKYKDIKEENAIDLQENIQNIIFRSINIK